jgi:urease accessory protein
LTVVGARSTSVLQTLSWLPRTEGSARLEFSRRGERTQLGVLHQAGAARVRFPKPAAGAPPEAVLLNMAGGLTGGDRMQLEVTLGDGAEVTVTTAAAEKIYRARDGDAAIGVKLALGAGARLAWLPQATILFDGSRLDRHTEVQLAGDARFLAVESMIFGRQAMDEDVHHGACRDAWRIRRDGVLVFADTFRVRGAIAAALDRPATLAGARAAAMLIYVAADAASRLEAVRAMLDGVQSTAGASSWNGLLVVRAFARDGRTLQGDIAPIAQALSGRPLPRVWQC